MRPRTVAPASIVYDAFGQMVRNLTDSHLYNPAGQRIGKLVGGTLNWGIVPWGDVAMVKWHSSETYFVHHNRLESSTMSTDHAGAVQEDMLYYPWGQAKTPSTVVDGTFAGMAGLIGTAGEETLVTPNRYYSATYGRWLSPDPLAGDVTNPQSLNRYAYALNNPVTFTDPSGLDPCDKNPNSIACGGREPGVYPPMYPYNTGGLFGLDEFDLAMLGLIYIGPAGYCPPQYPSCANYAGGTIGFDWNGFADLSNTGDVWASVASGEPYTEAPTELFLFGGSLPGNLPLGTPKSYWKPFKQGYKTALKDLKNPGCSQFFGGQGPATMQATEYRFLNLDNAKVGAATVSPTSVFINSTGPFMTFTGGSQAFGMSWSVSQFRAFILLHELGHQLSGFTGFQADADSPLNQAQSMQVIGACF